MNPVSIGVAADLRASPWLAWVMGLLSDMFAPAIRFEAAGDGWSGPLVGYGAAPPGAVRVPVRPRWQPGRMEWVELAVGGGRRERVLVYADTLAEGGDLPCDLLFNLFAYAACVEEVDHERASGPVHSYALRLTGDGRRFDRPYAELLARALVHAVLGEVPSPGPSALLLSHDVDAVAKRPVNRLKDGVFRGVNTLRALGAGRPGAALRNASGAMRMLFGSADYFGLGQLAAMEEAKGFRSVFNLFPGVAARGWREGAIARLLDPSYRLEAEPRLVAAIRGLAARGWEVGVHFSFLTWRGADRLAEQRRRVEETIAAGPVVSTRQHWFRFGFLDTWRDQRAAGIRLDTTLGFTDRPGFRAGLARPFRPYDHCTGQAMDLLVVPTILMDSHLRYYADQSPEAACVTIAGLLDEVAGVGGCCSAVWHTHVLSPDHGWGADYQLLLDGMAARGMAAVTPAQLLAD